MVELTRTLDDTLALWVVVSVGVLLLALVTTLLPQANLAIIRMTKSTAVNLVIIKMRRGR